MRSTRVIPPADWYAEGWHWLGSLFASPPPDDPHALEGAPRPPRPHPQEAPDDYFLDVRHRMQNRF
jgi:hypothetical protein